MQSISFTREQLINNFDRMYTYRDSRRYTHFVPVIPKGTEGTSLVEVNNPNTYPIYECNCSPEMSRNFREAIVEATLLERVEKIFDTKKPICVYSLGSGACYQELSICVGLAKRKYSVEKIVLVDIAYSSLQNLSVVQFSIYAKFLFPNVQISVYNNEDNYLEDIKNLKQPKPDIILCIDVEQDRLSFRQPIYERMLESSSNQSILVYHNHANDGIVSEVKTIQGKEN